LLSLDDLCSKLTSIDGRGYKSYAALEGVYRGRRFVLYIDHVQADPFAPPTRCRVRVKDAGIPPRLYANAVRRVALEDYLTRRFLHQLARRGPAMAMQRPGQEILPRTSVVLTPDFLEARFTVNLPARGRTVPGRDAANIFGRLLGEVVEGCLFWNALDGEKVRLWVETAEDQSALRAQLPALGLVAFVADGSLLPRESGISDLPVRGEVVSFQAPPELAVEMKAPNRGAVRGMGIPRGVTLIVGGGYHGKSTLLRALERGVYDHVPGDGRELVVTVPGAVKIRAEDGRAVTRVDISSFIGELPGNIKTTFFSTACASGSTSQAANIAEALEMGADLLLLDEDTCATNFMIRDHYMEQLVHAEPIVPFTRRVGDLSRAGVSTILVTGGAGDYFGVADRVVMMRDYVPTDVTVRAREIAAGIGGRAGGGPVKVTARVPMARAFVLGEEDRVKTRGMNICYGRTEIPLSAVEQLVDPFQASLIAEIMRYAGKKYVDGDRTLREVVSAAMDDLERYGLDVVSRFRGQHPGELAWARGFEIAAALNRWRGLAVR
jgi:predicted ABC-class ATPase